MVHLHAKYKFYFFAMQKDKERITYETWSCVNGLNKRRQICPYIIMKIRHRPVNSTCISTCRKPACAGSICMTNLFESIEILSNKLGLPIVRSTSALLSIM